MLAVPVDIVCSDKCFVNDQKEIMFHPLVRAALIGDVAHLPPIYYDEASKLFDLVSKLDGEGMIGEPFLKQGFTHIKVPGMLSYLYRTTRIDIIGDFYSHINRLVCITEMKDLVMDSGKLAKLDKLLEVLKTEGHRCLIYFQMTRMIDLMEEYLAYRQYKYLRLDGSSKISDRRDMVTDWQTRWVRWI